MNFRFPGLSFQSAKYFLLLLTVVFLVMPQLAYTQAPFVPCQPTEDNPDACKLGDLLSVPARIFNWLLGLAALVFMLIIVWSGARMMLYYFSDAPDTELVSAKNTLRHAIFGFFIIMASYLIVNTTLMLLGLNRTSDVAKMLQRFGL